MARQFRLFRQSKIEEVSPVERLTHSATSVSNSSTKTLRLEIERLQSELEKLRASKTSTWETKSSSGASRTSTRTRSHLAVLKEEVEQLKVSGEGEQRKIDIKAREEEIRHVIETDQTLDLAFLFDATGSMQPSINEVKDTISKIAESVGCTYPEAKLRVGFVVYRDYNDRQDDVEECDFTKSFKGQTSDFVRALSCVRAKGGDDDAEDVFTGLERVADLSWNSRNRVLFHIADAPCHGTQFHGSTVEDDYPLGDKLGRNISDLLQRLRDECLISEYFFCHLNESTENMVDVFRNAAAEKGDWIHEEFFHDVKNIPRCVASVCTETISKSLSTVGKSKPANTKYVPCEVSTAIPQWLSISPHTGYLVKHKRYQNLDQLLMRINSRESLDLEVPKTVQVKIAPHPFSNEGASRLPYYAQVRDEHEERLMVVKRFKTPLGVDTRQVHARVKYMEQMEVQAVSAQLADEFNKTTSVLGESKQVMFSLVSILRMGSSRFYNLEEVLHGDWKKYSNNGGYVNTHDYSATLQAFSHWTHERSKRVLMVTDLQGVQIRSAEGALEFVLSDPAIHSTDLSRFTRTNLGKQGFRLFYKSHICNDICRKLRLKPSTNGHTTEGTHLR